MSAERVVAAVQAAGLPVCRMAWPVGSAPSLPWCVFYEDGNNGFWADDRMIFQRHSWCVELYQRASDSESEAALEASLADAFGGYEKTEAWVEEDGCLQTTYTFAEFEKETD